MNHNALVATALGGLLAFGASPWGTISAQAGDVVKPINVVKPNATGCEAFGSNFFAVPGGACIKIGAYIRVQGATGASGDGTVTGAGPMAPFARFSLDTNGLNYQSRAAGTLDVRYMTALGMLRGYVRGGVEIVTPYNTLVTPPSPAWWDRGFFQLGGLTVGRQRSFFDQSDEVSGFTYGNPMTTGDTDLAGVTLAGYTLRSRTGWSASVSAEDPAGHNRFGVCDASAACWAINGSTLSDTAGIRMPDIVGNLRTDQGWGYLGVSGVLHQVAGSYYQTPNNVANGRPNGKLGFAVSGAGKLNLGSRGDSIGVTAVYSRGAPGYATKGNAWQIYGEGSTANVGVGWGADGIFDTGRQIELTEAWSVNAVFKHNWNPRWMTAVSAGYTAVNYNGAATAIINSHLPGAAGTSPCGVPVAGAVWPPLNIQVGSDNSCSPDYSFWRVGVLTQFKPVEWVTLGLDVSYTRLNTAYAGNGQAVPPPFLYNANNPRPGVNQIADQGVVTVLARAQMNFNQ